MVRRDDSAVDKIICVPDAIRMATAAVLGCDEFHTFDKKGRHGCHGLLPFAGKLEGYKPRITEPRPPAPPPATQDDLFTSLATPQPMEDEDAEGASDTTGAPEESGPGAGDLEDQLDLSGGSEAGDAKADSAGGDTGKAEAKADPDAQVTTPVAAPVWSPGGKGSPPAVRAPDDSDDGAAKDEPTSKRAPDVPVTSPPVPEKQAAPPQDQ